jgi:DUF1365 family protein
VTGRPAAGALYVGRVGHTRLRPRRHALGYRVFMLLADLDRLDGVARASRLLSVDRFNLLSFRPRDYGDGSAVPLAEQARARLRAAGVPLAAGEGRVELLTLPRVLGFVFNPISVYFGYGADGALRGIIYEVTSTFGRRHSYVARAEPDAAGEVRQGADKVLHVSPFMDMAMTYAFRVRPPGEDVLVQVTTRDQDGPMLSAFFSAARRPLADGAVLAAVLGHPLLTWKVVVAIHWEALRLWLKGVKLRPEPPDPATPMTVGRSA